MKCKYCSKTLKNNGALTVHEKTCAKVDKIRVNVIDDYLNAVLSINKLVKKYNIGKNTIVSIIGNNKRTIKEANKLGRELYRENFKHSDETKAKLREIRLNYMRNNPDKTAWRQKNMSYPEKYFKGLLENLGYDTKFKIVREYCIFPYFIDFAFIDIKLAIEIDGSQHNNPDIKKRDIRKDNKLLSEGWKVIRLQANNVINNTEEVIKLLHDLLIDKKEYQGYPIENYVSKIKRNKIKLDKERLKNGGRTDKEIE